MAGDWIKMRGNLWDDPRVAKIVDLTDSSEAAVVGALYWLWATADQHTEDGIMPGLTLKSIDRKTGVSGFAQALCDIGWLADHPDGVRIIDFEKHNGTSAKKRCQTAKRVLKHASANATLTQQALVKDESALAREEKSREEKITNTSPAKLPTCPVDLIVKAYHEILPELPGVRMMDDGRKKAIKDRWKWVLSTTKPDGTPRAETGEQAQDWFRAYFERARDNDFLMGKTARSADHQNWKPDIDYLMTTKGLKQVIEKTGVSA